MANANVYSYTARNIFDGHYLEDFPVTVQWNVAYLNVVYPNKSQVAESAKNGYQQKELSCSQCRSEAANLQMTKERGFHYFTFEGAGSQEVYNL